MKIMLPIEPTRFLNLAVQRQRSSECRNQCFFLESRLRAGHSDIEEGHMRIWDIVDAGGGGGGEELAFSVQLGMDLNADGQFPVF